MQSLSSVTSVVTGKNTKNIDLPCVVSSNRATMNNREILQHVKAVIEQLTTLVDTLSTKLETPEMVIAQKRSNSGLCCYCGEPHGDDKVYRGDHEKCYKKIQRLVSSKESTDEQAVRRGWWLPAEKGGRRFSNTDPIGKFKAEKTTISRKKR